MPTKAWPERPRILEVHTWVWLDTLTRRCGRPVTLATVPDEVLDSDLQGYDALWLMGVWERSPRGRRLALGVPELRAAYAAVLPDWVEADVVGSPYAIHAYEVAANLGGVAGLKKFREQLARRGLKLILDYVPNHLARDHAWTLERPGMFIGGSEKERRARPEEFFKAGPHVLAHGRDPYYPPWNDTVQINAFTPEARAAARATLSGLARLCDGVRCDMAMLLLNDVFEKTWGARAGVRPEQEFWADVFPAVRAQHPDFLFIAEVYWEREWDLQQLGFDYCYDKRLYDRLVHDPAESIRQHLRADVAYQDKLLRFLENHDEPRAATVFAGPQQRAAALLTFTLPGASLIYAGQTRGARRQLPIHLGREPQEPADAELEAFYRRLFAIWPAARPAASAWGQAVTEAFFPPNENPLVAHFWRGDQEHALVVVNYGAQPVRGLVRVGWLEEGPAKWNFNELLTEREVAYPATNLARYGLYVELPPWGGHVFKVKAAK